jgi:phospholipid/cholesterol/gamma-HCH transport system permease protein
MFTDSVPATGLHLPLSWVGRKAMSGVAYLGGVGLLAGSAVRSLVRPADPTPALVPALIWQLARMLGMGFPLVGLVHVGMGSFLSMQSYFGGTFVDGAGAVVGVGLIRNLAPLMAGMTLAGLLASRLTPELRARSRAAAGNAGDSTVQVPDASRLTAIRVLAAMVTSPILGLWGSAVGMVIGWLVGLSLLGVSTHSFTHMFLDMLWTRDVVGLVVKGIAFGLFGALFACFEGLRGPRDADPDTVASAAFRAVCLTFVAILLINSSWFIFVYRAGPAFGPTLLSPPAPGPSMD